MPFGCCACSGQEGMEHVTIDETSIEPPCCPQAAEDNALVKVAGLVGQPTLWCLGVFLCR